MEYVLEIFGQLNEALVKLYEEMIPLADDLLTPAKQLGAIATLLYISYQVSVTMAKGQPIQLFPLLRPFALLLAIIFYSGVIDVLSGVLSPVVEKTAKMAGEQQKAVADLLEKKEKTVKEKKQNDEDFEIKDEFENELEKKSIFNVTSYFDRAAYNFRRQLSSFLRNLLELLYQTAILAIGAVRTFYLIVLIILGPIVLALSILDIFKSSLTSWISKYLSTYLWLPVSHILGAIMSRIQLIMLQADIDQIEAGESVIDASDFGYMAFLIIAITGYITVPSISNFIVASTMNQLASKVTGTAMKAASGAAGGGGMPFK